MLCDQDHLLCNLGPFLSTLQIKETWVWFPGSKILKQELRKQKWRQERTNLCQWNPVTTYLHLEIMHIFFLDEIFFNCSENGNETTFKKLTVMENLNVTMISKKKEIISLILILLERRKKNVSREMRQLAMEALGFRNLLFCAPKWTRFKLSSRESQSKVHDDFKMKP